MDYKIEKVEEVPDTPKQYEITSYRKEVGVDGEEVIIQAGTSRVTREQFVVQITEAQKKIDEIDAIEGEEK